MPPPRAALPAQQVTPRGAIDDTLPNRPAAAGLEASDAGLDPFVQDWLEEWRTGWEHEQTSYKSFVVFLEMKLRQAMLVTAKLGLPNPHRTAVVCDCFERMSEVFGRCVTLLP